MSEPGGGATAGGAGSLAARLRTLFPEASGRSLKHWLLAGRVRVDGAVARDGRAPLPPGARVALGEPTPRPIALPAPLRLVLEDDHLIAIDKPAGLLSVATGTGRERTAYRLVWDYLAARRPARRPFVVHRLDRETSGLLVLAKSPEAKRALQAQFEARTVERIYVAVVAGRVRDDEGTLRSRLVDADRGGRVRPARGRERGAREAITHYRVIARDRDRTWLELSLGTGRRQQIRAQLAALGHPIVGDETHRGPRARRLHLHATRLGFTHPATRAPVRLDSPVPDTLRPPRPGARPRR